VKGLENSLIDLPVIDKILGVIYGNALGDAYGLATEFEDKAEVTQAYGAAPVPFPGYKRTGHNMRWKRGDWTDDTDQMILILESILQTGGKIDPHLFAKKLLRWVYRGFPELGDFGGMGLGATVAKVVHHKEFLTNPHKASEEVWEFLNRNAAANGAVMRTSIMGVWQFQDLEKVRSNTIDMCRVTHHDPRCIASTVAVTRAIALMLQGKPCNTREELLQIRKDALTEATQFLPQEQQEDFLYHMVADSNIETLYKLKLDEPKAIGYTLKCAGSGFWGLFSDRNYKDTMNLLIKEGGDADTNGAVCGAMIGARIGYKNLPQDWLSAMPHKGWLDEKVVHLLNLMKLLPSGYIKEVKKPEVEEEDFTLEVDSESEEEEEEEKK